MSLGSMKSSHHFCRCNSLTLSVADVTKTLHYHHFENNSEVLTLNAAFLQYVLQEIIIVTRKLLKMKY